MQLHTPELTEEDEALNWATLSKIFIPPPRHCVRTKGSALTFTDRVHSSDGSASFASVHVRIRSRTHALMHWHISQHASEEGWMRGGRRNDSEADNKVKDGGECDRVDVNPCEASRIREKADLNRTVGDHMEVFCGIFSAAFQADARR
ncbi:hypothetical protein D9C73_022729 [Collichthys lucidus]|uniref:Uncharacterized protein n=1 Tax=Collichthys lucidus TaxID=240159 RepID=A0A4U5VLV0_COLLU|nr:hypothetical protein D9C73_022729 [Collichthys lucidus]